MGGGHHHSPEAMPKAEQDLELLKKHQVPIPLRDHCAHLLVPLNVCRQETLYSPFHCQHQRHTYEECQFIQYERRAKMKQDIVKAKQAAA
mmetsp:Transcript_6155/g.12659  ORF Transcript_6155/g.12659 Transcript_6155/m.12659 type:complete len:90 (+) Transcript_6155:26-295(+)